MNKIVFLYVCFYLCISSNAAFSKSTKHKKKSSHSHSRRKHRHHGTGPDLKQITKGMIYIENPSNGITPIEKSNTTF